MSQIKKEYCYAILLFFAFALPPHLRQMLMAGLETLAFMLFSQLNVGRKKKLCLAT